MIKVLISKLSQQDHPIYSIPDLDKVGFQPLLFERLHPSSILS